MKSLLAALVFLAVGSRLHAQSPPATLKAAYEKYFQLGAAVNDTRLTDAEVRLLRDNFTNLTTENCMKSHRIHPARDQWAFDDADALTSFAQTNGLRVNGHTLVWREKPDSWFFQGENGQPPTRETVLAHLREHVTGEVAHFRNRVDSWDVVNEALGNGSEYLAPTEWARWLGEDYIAEAFLAARQADPSVKLYYNDYNIEQPAKRDKALRLIRNLKARQVPIDGIGIQGHWQLDRVPYADIEQAITAFHTEGLKVMITELDLGVVPRKVGGADTAQRESGSGDPYATGCPPEILQRQAEQYARLFALFRRHADKISRVTFWNLHDGRSWLNSWPRKRTEHPLLWGRDLQPKPAFAAVLAEAR